MMKKKLVYIIFIFCIGLKGYTQQFLELPRYDLILDIDSLNYDNLRLKPIDASTVFDTLDYLRFITLNTKLDTLLATFNYINLENKFLLGRYFLQQGYNDKASLIFKEIMRFPFWGQFRGFYVDSLENQTYFQAFFEIYWKSGVYLIEALDGNLEELNKLDFVPASYGHLICRLRLAIEKAGGKWSRDDCNDSTPKNNYKN